MADVTAVIVNYKTPDLTKGAVRSCLTEPDVEEVIVIDNGSGDDSADILTEEFRGQRVRVMENDDNVGFATANNKGISRARTEYVFLLNSDAFAVPGAIGILLQRLKQDPQIGIIAPQILESDGHTPQARNFGPFPDLRTIFLRDQSVLDQFNPDWVSGVAMMARKQSMADVDGFDDRYFMYYEDVDLCRRMRQSGKKIVREPKAKVVHFGGQSRRSNFERKKLYYESQDRYLELTGISPFGRNLVRVARWPVYALRALRLSD